MAASVFILWCLIEVVIIEQNFWAETETDQEETEKKRYQEQFNRSLRKLDAPWRVIFTLKILKTIVQALIIWNVSKPYDHS